MNTLMFYANALLLLLLLLLASVLHFNHQG